MAGSPLPGRAGPPPVRELSLQTLELSQHGLKGPVRDEFDVLPPDDVLLGPWRKHLGIAGRDVDDLQVEGQGGTQYVAKGRGGGNMGATRTGDRGGSVYEMRFSSF